MPDLIRHPLFLHCWIMPRSLQLDSDGAQHFPAAFSAVEMESLETLFLDLPENRPGTRLGPVSGLAEAIQPATRIAVSTLGGGARPVRATLFDKSPARNWALGWHQDRTIAVRIRIDVPGFADWTVKHGIPHAVPPFTILKRMLTVRIHLDPVGPDNAPLLIAPGSHRRGPLPETQIPKVVSELGTISCEAERGDLWLYAAPILHASARAVTSSRRRVLQILYSADDLPGDLAWLGV
jgi:hypothetical protein